LRGKSIIVFKNQSTDFSFVFQKNQSIEWWNQSIEFCLF